MKQRKFFAVLMMLFFVSVTSRSQDFATTNPSMVKVIGDTLGTKMMVVTYLPGVTTEVHTHPVSMIYVLEGGTLKAEFDDGKTETVTITAGQFVQLPPDPGHKTTNTGTTPVKIILVEISK